MINRDNISRIIKGYMPNADEDQIKYIAQNAEQEIIRYGRDVIRILVMQKIAKSQSSIDTRI